MSTYLFVLTVGELERITTEAEGVTIGVVATIGKAAKGQFALDSAAKLLAWFNDYFGVKYPLPKLDLIAVPGGFGGAMENWGGITFFESRLLFDPATNPDSARRGIFSIIAHEMAHQWFGDLVTMAWWDNLWLNEGFATWMATKAAEQFYPQWQSWLNGYGAKQFAMALDARRTSHPIQQPIGNESEAMIAFDAITYNKGQALIRMLENYLGEAAFRDGIRAYIGRACLWQHHHGRSLAGAGARGPQAGDRYCSVLYRTGRRAADLGRNRLQRRCAAADIAAGPFRDRTGADGGLRRATGGSGAVGKVGTAPSADVVLLQGSTEVPGRILR